MDIDREKDAATNRREFVTMKGRFEELDKLIKKLYEDNAAGKISERLYDISCSVTMTRNREHWSTKSGNWSRLLPCGKCRCRNKAFMSISSPARILIVHSIRGCYEK